MQQKLSFYDFNPSLAAAVLFAALYGICFILTTALWVKHRAWVCVIMVVAVAMETVGYIGRSISTQNVTNQSIYVLQFALTVLAPVLVAAFCYIIFGRIVFLAVPRGSRTLKLIWVPPRFVTPIFVFFDIIALLLQLAGAVIISGTQATDKDAQKKINNGKGIAQAGVVVQLAAFGLFSIIAVRFNFTSKRFKKSAHEQFPDEENDRTLQMDTAPKQKHWPAILRVVNLVSGLILIRTIYRMIEFNEGPSGYLSTNEWCTYVFDALVILPCFVLFIWWHPAKYLPYLGFRLPKHAR
ncbi:RTA1 like protein [Talaromyces proteolyticus]|uniref:RTA1 like protein n=1 Tax=Talaromyces proteolyticus TaxID=1131652 RepID=A0AAD4KWP6_9EURO|nr:RTA1 like protein [Talaromyces proteolyticus]KAH8698587.1 RTA1 like protein [Talaromyces proteolyticus]